MTPERAYDALVKPWEGNKRERGSYGFKTEWSIVIKFLGIWASDLIAGDNLMLV